METPSPACTAACYTVSHRCEILCPLFLSQSNEQRGNSTSAMSFSLVN